jgi:hypothetical protein
MRLASPGAHARARDATTALEILVPLVFLGLLCLPRYLIADTQFPSRFYAPTNLTELSWSAVRLTATACSAFC